MWLAMGTEMVVAEGVRKSFGRLEGLAGIDLTVPTGQVMCINHLEKIDSGRLGVDGELVGYRQRGTKLYELSDRDVCAKRAEIGMVFQRFNLFPHLTALENVVIGPMKVKGESRRDAEERGRTLLERGGLGDKLRA